MTSSSFPPSAAPYYFPAEPKPSAWNAWGRHVALFVVTGASVYLSGGPLLVAGLLSILFAHEMGHYLACRYYKVDATLPFFIPFPVISLVGTLGAFIRIKSPFPNRKALFDIGIAGPLAGFAVCMPVLALSLREMTVARIDASSGALYLGDPLLLQWVTRLAVGSIADGYTVVIGPLGMAAWFGLFMTALNLIPIGQLDGGHVMYALFGERANLVSRAGWWVCIGLIYLSPSWIVWAILLRVLGRSHPRTMNEYEPIGIARVLVALLGLAIFVVSFVPSPIVGSWDTILDLFT